MKKRPKIILTHVTPISQFPLGLGMIAAIFEEEGFEIVPIVNTFLKYQSTNTLVKNILSLEPDIVGISFQTIGVKANYEVVKLLKQANEKILIIGGGNHLTLFPEEGIENGFDICVIGEGEETCRQLIRYYFNPSQFPLSRIQGVAFRDGNDNIVQTSKAPIVSDLDALPLPARHLFDEDAFRQPDGDLKGYGKIFTGRGCPGRCTFCCPNVFGRTFRHRSAKNVVDEIELVNKKYNVNLFSFIDDTFLANVNHVKEMCHEIIRRGLNIRWNCTSRVNRISVELLRLLKQSGCFMMNFGIESGNKETLRRIKKGISVEKAIEAVRMTQEEGIKVYANIMTGFPWEGPDEIQDTIDLVHRLSGWVDQFSNKGVLIPEPGTELYEELKSYHDIEGYWLKETYQNVGASIFQNVTNPYKISNWFQRNMYDDTYVRKELYFKYSPEQKKAIFKLAKSIGIYNFKRRYGNTWKAKFYITLGLISSWLANIVPDLEIKVVSSIKRSAATLHSSYGIGYCKRNV